MIPGLGIQRRVAGVCGLQSGQTSAAKLQRLEAHTQVVNTQEVKARALRMSQE